MLCVVEEYGPRVHGVGRSSRSICEGKGNDEKEKKVRME